MNVVFDIVSVLLIGITAFKNIFKLFLWKAELETGRVLESFRLLIPSPAGCSAWSGAKAGNRELFPLLPGGCRGPMTEANLHGSPKPQAWSWVGNGSSRDTNLYPYAGAVSVRFSLLRHNTRPGLQSLRVTLHRSLVGEGGSNVHKLLFIQHTDTEPCFQRH